MKAVIGLVFGVLAVLGLSLAASSNAPNRPPGIAADRWAPISSTLGVVLVPDSQLSEQPALGLGVVGASPPPGPAPHLPEIAPIVDPTGLIANPSPAVQAIIDEGRPVRGYIMVKRGKVWHPLAVVAPTIDN